MRGRARGRSPGAKKKTELRAKLGEIAGEDEDGRASGKGKKGRGDKRGPLSIFSGGRSKRKDDDFFDEKDLQEEDSPKLDVSQPQRTSSWKKLSLLHELAGSPFSKRPVEEDDSDDEETLQEKSWRVRETLRLARIRGRDVESKRDRAFQACGTVAQPPPGTEPWMLRLQRKCGILELRVGIQVRKIQLAEDPPYFKDIHEVVTSLKFEAFIGLLIILNAICIGWDTFFLPDERRPFILAYSEHVFTAIFLVEFFMRIFAFTTLWLCNLMNLFDTFLIWGTGVLVTWILLPIGIPVQAARRLGALRILRLARLIRAIRIMPFFKELWMLVQGVMECSTLLLWAMVIGGMVHFMFAVIVLEVIVKNEKFKDDAEVQEYFGTLIKAMFSLFQVMTLDSWSGIVRPIRERAPEATLIFGLFMGLASIVLSNLLIAIVVQNAYDAGESDVEAMAQAKLQEQRKMSAELLETFQDLDEDGSGALSKEEFTDCLDDYQFVRKMKMLDIDLEELPDFFDILDDGDGQVDQEEFVGGMMKMQGRAMSSDMLKATTLIRQQNAQFSKLHDAFVIGALDTFNRMEGDMDSVHRSMNDIMQMTAEVMQKLDEVGVRRILKATVKDVSFVHDPDIEKLMLAEKRNIRKKRRAAQEVSDYDIEHLIPKEAKMKRLVPASWIVREGRSFEAKNPGKAKLLKDPDLKQELKQKAAGNNKIKQKILAAQRPVGIHEEMNTKWNTLDAPLNHEGTLRKIASEKDGSSPPHTQLPTMVNLMDSCFVPKVNVPKSLAGPAPPPLGAPPILKPTLSYPEMKAMASPFSAESKAAAAAAEAQDAEIYDSPEDYNNLRRSRAASRRNSQGDETARKLFEHPNAVPDTLL